jgi:hypothetical protein
VNWKQPNVPNSRIADGAASSERINETYSIFSERHHDPILSRFLSGKIRNYGV